MTNVNEHQMPQRRVVDEAEKAIQIATDAEMAVRHAQLESDPQKLTRSIAKLETAQRAAQQSQSQLESITVDSNRQELLQVRQQLEQSIQSMEVVDSGIELPKQVR